MTSKKAIFSLLFASLLAAQVALAQDPEEPRVPSARVKPTRGFSVEEVDGEPVLRVWLSEVTCFGKWEFRDSREEEFYWKTVRDVKRTLPYAKMICETLLETYEYLETIPTERERQDYLRRMESAVFNEYKPVLKKFTKGQAKVLCKLITRETDQTGYNLLKAFLGTFRAGFWQTFGRFFGVNINIGYKPETDRQDAIVERVATLVELGVL